MNRTVLRKMFCACCAIALGVGVALVVAGTVQSVTRVEDRPPGVTVVRSRLATLGGQKLARDPAKFTVKVDHLKAGVYTDPQTKKVMPYRYFVPEGLAPLTKVPLVLFLHGLGEAGNDNRRQLLVPGPLEFVQPEWQQRAPCIFVAPQTASGGYWVDATFDTPSDNLRMAVAIVDKLAAETGRVDARRLYITGLSSGGIGVWDAIVKFPGKFAAAVPISAWSDPGPKKYWPRRQKVAVWAFYNRNEKAFVRAGSNKMLEMIVKQGGVGRLTVYDAGGHNAWGAAYQEPDFAPWLFSQRIEGSTVEGKVVGKLAGK